MSTAKRALGPTDHSTFGSLTGGRAAWVAIDAVALLALLGLVALGFLPVYGTAWLFVSVLGFGAVGIGLALVSWRLRWGAGMVALVAAAAWLLLGGFLTMPSSTIGFVVPTLRTLRGLVTGPVTAWRDMLTLDPPIGETFNLLTVPGLIGLLAGLLGMLISLRTARPVLAFVPSAVGYVVAVVLGSRVAFEPLLVGAVFFLIVLTWTSHRRAVTRGLLSRGVRLKPLAGVLGLAVVAASGVAAYAAVPLLAPKPERETVRAAIEPPIDLAQYASPLQGFRANITQNRETTLLEVSGAEKGDIVRIATLDAYDGLNFRVASLADEALESTTFTRVGQWIDDDAAGADVAVEVTVRGYDGVWVPTAGRTRSIDFAGERALALGENFYYNRSSGTGIDTAGLREGDSYLLEATVAERPTDAEIGAAGAGDFSLPDVVGAPDDLVNLAHQWSDGVGTAGQVALRFEEELQQGYFSHGQEEEMESVAGHSQKRLTTLLQAPDRMVGDHEQYATAMALMAREVGIPARVIYGYEVAGSQTITGDQVGAWTELYLDGLGWVTFNPTPPKDRVLDIDELPPPPQPQPYVENPPPPPARPEVPPPDDDLPVDPAEEPEVDTPIDWAQIGAFAALTGIPLITIVVPIVLIVGMKLRRRSHRRNDPIVANRIAGAWSELVDKARDLGRSPSASATRTEQAQLLVEEFPKLRAVSDPVALAKEADWIVFAPGDPSEATAREYWGSTGLVRRGMRKSLNWFRWAFSSLSTKSFRKYR
ncbi:transglutaminase domain-containing protein [Tessaracoccus defluvii]|uniref:Transglutaminase-like domain-containing protein n=1 Tax=Tessaracoccus defluvii TaxID=1285901 RepID=A0A7H0H3B3_9ACTN|nr:transglutaminaseTgpA domain-containing protein [Tessaracoccus defluvii]QNP55029.1 hypothetical protein H9L22_12195 [Tessaracoccus defluvii]